MNDTEVIWIAFIRDTQINKINNNINYCISCSQELTLEWSCVIYRRGLSVMTCYNCYNNYTNLESTRVHFYKTQVDISLIS